ncbi:hypothetical protein L1049_007506 [Liquidambar formosana]|uniref:Uncharacterized protein n=1 Tax=Liquidambar formosana TaxID=63359 RepID=A0AAP0S8F4_LIQFO
MAFVTYIIPLLLLQQSIDVLKDKLLYTSFELQSARKSAEEETNKNKKTVKQLLQLLKIVSQERDEARDHLQKLLKKILPSIPLEISPIPPLVQPESLPSKIPEANTNVMESRDHLPETYNYHSYGSSPLDCSFDEIFPPDFCHAKMLDTGFSGVPKQPLVAGSNGLILTGKACPGPTMIDHALAVTDNLVKGKPLPKKGRLLQAVMEAGPLLQTLLVAGQLPQWQNPPPLHQPLQISSIITQKAVVDLNGDIRSPSSSSHLEIITHGSSQISASSSTLNFLRASGSCLNVKHSLSDDFNSGSMHNQIPIWKRRRFQ